MVRRTIDRSDHLLSLPPRVRITIDVESDPEQTVSSVGVGGDSAGQSLSLYLDLSFHDLREALAVSLQAALAHELNHTKRIMQGPGYGSTLLEQFVTEGIADAFSYQALPETPPRPWDSALTAARERELWNLAQKELNQDLASFSDHERWFFGTADIPPGAGYTIGYHIVEGYLARHPASTPAGITGLRAQKILSGSGYSP